jgi:hypothetical protein
MFAFIGDEMDTFGKFVDCRLLAAQIENTNFRIRDTTTETRLRVGLVLDVTITASWTSTHF